MLRGVAAGTGAVSDTAQVACCRLQQHHVYSHRFGRASRAEIAQLVARRSHNPKVVSSIFTFRMLHVDAIDVGQAQLPADMYVRAYTDWQHLSPQQLCSRHTSRALRRVTHAHRMLAASVEHHASHHGRDPCDGDPGSKRCDSSNLLAPADVPSSTWKLPDLSRHIQLGGISGD